MATADDARSMPFFLFLLVNATLFLRPAELMPALREFPIYEGLMLACCVLSVEPLRRQFTPRNLVLQPVTLCLFGVMVSIVISHAVHGNALLVERTAGQFLKTSLYYLLLVGLVTTPQRLRWFLATVALCATVMVGVCVVDYLGVIDFEFVEHIADWGEGLDERGEGTRVWRMSGTGIFSDPNDISLIIVGAGVLCLYFFTDRQLGMKRFLWLAPLCVLAEGLLCTRSRGGLLSAAGAGMLYLMFRKGKSVAIAAAVLGAIALPLVAGRQGNISLEEGTGQHRIQLWAAGLDAIKSADVVFGIGKDLYYDAVGQVAHNSFVHAYVELGFFGGTLFLGCFFFPFLALYRMSYQNGIGAAPRTEMERLAPFMAAFLAGQTVGMLSLSRCYAVPTFLVVGVAAAYMNIAGLRANVRRCFVIWDQQHVKRLAWSSAGLLAGLFVFTRLFARFG